MPGVGLVEIVVILLTIGVYVAIAAAVVVAVRWLLGGRRKDPNRDLDDRLARGEITLAEHQEARRILGT